MLQVATMVQGVVEAFAGFPLHVTLIVGSVGAAANPMAGRVVLWVHLIADAWEATVKVVWAARELAGAGIQVEMELE